MKTLTLPAPIHPRRWTLRTRLVVTQVALMAAVSVVIGLVSVLALKHVLLGQLDAQLQSSAVRAGQAYDEHQPRSGTSGSTNPTSGTGPSSGTGPDSGTGPPPLPPASGLGALAAQIPTQDGQASGAVSTGQNYVTGQSLTAAQLAVLAVVPVDRQTHQVHLEGLGDYLVRADSRLSDGEVLITGLPLGDVEETTLILALVIVGVAMVGLLAVGLAGAATVRLNLRPLRRVSATARRVAQLPLDRGEVALAVRVPEGDTDDHTEVGQVGHALNRMLEHVATALQVRQDSEMRVRRFVSDASHELRTPLASIRGYAELTRRSRSQVSPDVAHALERVESEAQRMTDLVEELLLLARLDEGRPLDRAPVDLSQLVVDAVSDAHVAGPDHRWCLDLPDEPVTVVGDQRRLHQVVANLLTNARTHTPPGTQVRVSLTADDGTAALGVADTGPGIPAALVPEIFERFSRADSSRSRAAGSTGLGLAIVQAVVRAHGGRVALSSRPGETVFTVRLPLDASPGERLPSVVQQVPGAAVG
jgi:two-component system OmpR family sensor kinase